MAGTMQSLNIIWPYCALGPDPYSVPPAHSDRSLPSTMMVPKLALPENIGLTALVPVNEHPSNLIEQARKAMLCVAALKLKVQFLHSIIPPAAELPSKIRALAVAAA